MVQKWRRYDDFSPAIRRLHMEPRKDFTRRIEQWDLETKHKWHKLRVRKSVVCKNEGVTTTSRLTSLTSRVEQRTRKPTEIGLVSPSYWLLRYVILSIYYIYILIDRLGCHIASAGRSQTGCRGKNEQHLEGNTLILLNRKTTNDTWLSPEI